MSGCSWQEKSFSVSTMIKPGYICRECNKKIEGIYKYDGDYFCKECFLQKGKINSSIGIFHTDKDLSYNFVTDIFDGKPIQINSKRQFKSLLKQYGLADASMKECKQEADFRKRVNAESDILARRKNAERIFERNRELLKFRRK